MARPRRLPARLRRELRSRPWLKHAWWLVNQGAGRSPGEPGTQVLAGRAPVAALLAPAVPARAVENCHETDPRDPGGERPHVWVALEDRHDPGADQHQAERGAQERL